MQIWGRPSYVTVHYTYQTEEGQSQIGTLNATYQNSSTIEQSFSTMLQKPIQINLTTANSDITYQATLNPTYCDSDHVIYIEVFSTEGECSTAAPAMDPGTVCAPFSPASSGAYYRYRCGLQGG